jgi:N-acetylglucosaminyldiphosphoundecaprenol N-acetyl-beta-D-mannosaminyltransferase
MTMSINRVYNIFDLKMNQLDQESFFKQISDWLNDFPQRVVVTINPEFIVAAQKNKLFKEFLSQADLAVCDGAGLAWAAKWLTGERLNRLTGVDLTEKLLTGAVPGAKIFLVGASDDAINLMGKKYPDYIVGGKSGGRLDQKEYLLEDNDAVLRMVGASDANIVLVALGQVKQELWIKNNLAKMPNVKVAIGVGGTFDYLSGKTKRAPQWWRRLGLEWLFRLITQPQRIKRIFNATVYFTFLVIREKLSSLDK